MSIAYKAARLVTEFCKATWPDSWATMPSTMADHFMDAFDGASYRSHKYINQLDKINEHLGATNGGVFGYWRFSDKTQILLTCDGFLAVIDSEGLRRID